MVHHFDKKEKPLGFGQYAAISGFFDMKIIY